MPDQHPIVDESRPEKAGWFRGPSRREHWIAAGLFVGFGLFFVVLFVVEKNWWFRWVILGLGVVSIFRGVRHVLDARAVR